MSGVDPDKIDLDHIEISASGGESIEVPFDIKAKDFLDSAFEDLRGRSTRDTVNALGNIKRSIHCLFDSLLFAVNFLDYSRHERWDFPKKMDFLGEIGIITPYILSKINLTRNLLEHEYEEPNRSDVETAYDVALLLFYSTVRFTKEFVDLLDVETDDGKWGIVIRIDRTKRRIDLLDEGNTISITWDQRPTEYKRWLNLVFRVRYYHY